MEEKEVQISVGKWNKKEKKERKKKSSICGTNKVSAFYNADTINKTILCSVQSATYISQFLA